MQTFPYLRMVDDVILRSFCSVCANIKLKSVQNVKIECVKCHSLVLATHYIEANFGSIAIIPERGFSIPSSFLE